MKKMYFPVQLGCDILKSYLKMFIRLFKECIFLGFLLFHSSAILHFYKSFPFFASSRVLEFMYISKFDLLIIVSKLVSFDIIIKLYNFNFISFYHNSLKFSQLTYLQMTQFAISCSCECFNFTNFIN